MVKDAGIGGTDYPADPARSRSPRELEKRGRGLAWVLAWKLCQFGRDLAESLVYRALLRRRGIELISHKEPIPEGRPGLLITHIPHGGRPVLRGSHGALIACG